MAKPCEFSDAAHLRIASRLTFRRCPLQAMWSQPLKPKLCFTYVGAASGVPLGAGTQADTIAAVPAMIIRRKRIKLLPEYLQGANCTPYSTNQQAPGLAFRLPWVLINRACGRRLRPRSARVGYRRKDVRPEVRSPNRPRHLRVPSGYSPRPWTGPNYGQTRQK